MTPTREHGPAPRSLRVLAFVEAATLTGPAKNLLEFARHAAAPRSGGGGAEIRVATFVRRPGTNAFLQACERAGVAATAIAERRAFDPAVVGEMRRLVAAHHPDIIQTHSLKSHFLVRLAGLDRRYRWVAFHHGYTYTNLKVRAYNQLDRFSLPRAARVVTVCGAFARDLIRRGVPGERILVRHNSVRPFTASSAETVGQLLRELGIPGRAQVLLSVGRLSREKGHADLMRAMTALAPLPCPVRLVLVGEGPERNRLESAARSAGLAGHVVFAGQRSEVAPFYTMADALVLPSHTEGSPNVLLEALAAGLPSVATRVGGVPEIVQDGREALLVAARQPREMAAALRRLLSDPDLRRDLGVRAQAAAAAYTAEAYRDAVLALYADCMEACPHREGSTTGRLAPAAAGRAGGRG